MEYYQNPGEAADLVIDWEENDSDGLSCIDVKVNEPNELNEQCLFGPRSHICVLKCINPNSVSR